jgi:DNA-binding HxlR family transcriptional regulator
VTTFDRATIALISRRWVTEVLAELAEGPRTFRTLRRGCRGHGRELHDALRALAATGAIRRTGAGASWDSRPTDDGVYALTADGHRLVEHLSDLDAWTEAYQQSITARSPERRDGSRN